jgi:hypothetical protein
MHALRILREPRALALSRGFLLDHGPPDVIERRRRVCLEKVAADCVLLLHLLLFYSLGFELVLLHVVKTE